MFQSPWYLALLLLLPPAAWALFAKRRRHAAWFSSVSQLQAAVRSLRQRLLWLPSCLTLAALACLIVALARPREGRERTVSDSEGIAIQMVVDRSGSMRALDFKIDGEPVDRLTAVKQVAARFVLGGDELEGRFSDLVGLITFAGFADSVTPPTLDHAFLVDRLEEAKIADRRDEDGTAIGDALALAVEKLNGLANETKAAADKDRDDKDRDGGQPAAAGQGSPRTSRPSPADAAPDSSPSVSVPAQGVQSKVVILLTDGENTAGELEPLQAAELAGTMGVKVYTIGVGTKGRAPVPVRDGMTGRTLIRTMPVNIDEATLRQVAATTGAKYYRATDTDSLLKIYREIDQLEKSKVESRNFVDYRELAVQPIYVGRFQAPPLLLASFVMLALRFTLQQTWLREFP